MDSILLRTALATLVAFAGGVLGVTLGHAVPRRLNLLVYAAMGVLLAVTACDIPPEAKAVLTWPEFAAGVVSGYALLWLVGRYVYHVCPSCAISAFDEETTRRLGETAVLLMVALGIHSGLDGIAVVVGDRMVGQAHLGILVAVALHKLPEGLALALLLLGAGYLRRAALLRTLGVEAMTTLGGVLGVLTLKDASPPWLGLLFAHVGGGFLYLVGNTIAAFADHRASLSLRPLFAAGGLSFGLTALLHWAFSG